MLQNDSLHSLRFSILFLFSCTVATAQETAAQTKAPSTKAGTKSSLGGKSGANKSKSSSEENGEKVSEEVAATPGIELFATSKMEMKFGMRISSNQNFCTALHATIPFPLNWPEQKVTVISNQFPQGVNWAFRDLPVGSKQNALARQLVMDIVALGPNNQVDLLVNVEIEKS